MMKKNAVVFIAALLAAVSAHASFTVATFSNPSTGSSDSLFKVDWSGNSVTGGWADGKSGLNLEFAYTGNVFNDVWFEMSPVTIVSQVIPGQYGFTGAGVISFYQAGTISDPLMVIHFDSATVNSFVFGSSDTAFSGSQITLPLDEEQFSFAFANKTTSNGGFSATAAFDSSAVPEPATLFLLGTGGLALIRRKRS